MFLSVKIFSQNSFGLTGYWGLPEKLSAPVFSYESNSSNFTNIRDWGIFFNYGAEFSSSINSNLYSISISKTLANHNLSGRFTPSYQKEFLFSTGEAIVVNDTTTQSLEANYTYKELFGLGYSYKFTSQFSAGFTFRFFNQDFNQEIVRPIFGDTLYLVRETLNEKVNFWKGDLGVDYLLNDDFQFRVSSINLLNFGNSPQTDEFKDFEMKQITGAILSASYTPVKFFNLHFVYETSNSFQVSGTGDAGNLFYGLTAFHDKYQSPFIAGIVPVLGYKTDLFEILVSGVKYFSDRTGEQSFSEFAESGIHNVLNNQYSFDKAVLSVTFTISSGVKQKAKIIDVEILQDIFPTLNDNYIDYPIAIATIVNLTDERITIKPSVQIEGVHSEDIQSPQVSIEPFDTTEVKYYTVIPDSYEIDKAILSYADFYIIVDADEPDDKFQKAILVNGVNAWDGKVSNLKHFIKKDINISMSYSKSLLSANKELLETLPAALSVFNKARILFNDFVSRLIYTSDPRASAEYVQFPNQTIELKGGDCDDLSVAYSSLLESIGIQTALVDYKANGKVRHVNLLFNTELSPNQASLITNNDTKFFIRENLEGDDQVWLPVETTSLTDFETAWSIGVEKFNREAIHELGIATGKIEIIDIY
jgi:hypothetical protein